MKAFHLTKIDNLYYKDGICSKGLIPTCGERSRMIGDENIAIYFTSKYQTLPTWWLYLYPNTDLNELCVLSFEIDQDECTNHINKTEFFTNKAILPEKINLVHFYDKRSLEEIPFIYLQDDIKYYGNELYPSKVEIILEEIPIRKLTKKRYLHRQM